MCALLPFAHARKVARAAIFPAGTDPCPPARPDLVPRSSRDLRSGNSERDSKRTYSLRAQLYSRVGVVCFHGSGSMAAEGQSIADSLVTEFATYSDFLDSQITPSDLFYLEVHVTSCR